MGGRWVGIGLIFTASDEFPFTPTWGTGADRPITNSGDDWAYVNRLGGPGCKTLTKPAHVNNYIKTECFQVPTAPDLAFWNANCNPKPNSLVDANNDQDHNHQPENRHNKELELAPVAAML